MKLALFQVDAFATQLFSGNPAAVVPLETWLADETLQLIAQENNLSETAFFVPAASEPGNDFELRWFTPKLEVPLCGHATLATAHVLKQHLGFLEEVVMFGSRSGSLQARYENDLLVLDFPAIGRRHLEVTPDVCEALGARPLELYEAQSGQYDEDNLLAVFETEDQIRTLKPEFAHLARIKRGCTIVTAPGKEADFVSRYFAPGAGIDEDPVTGSAHCILTPYWAQRLDKSTLNAHQLSARGGQLGCTLKDDRVLIAGRAVTYLEGTILL